MAGMPFKGNSNKIKKVGYYVIQFIFTEDNCLISEKTIKRIIY